MGCGVSKHPVTSATSATTPVGMPFAATAVEKDKVSGLRRAAKASDLDPDPV